MGIYLVYKGVVEDNILDKQQLDSVTLCDLHLVTKFKDPIHYLNRLYLVLGRSGLKSSLRL